MAPFVPFRLPFLPFVWTFSDLVGKVAFEQDERIRGQEG